MSVRAPRGVTLIEGLMASMVLLVGMVGVLQGVLFASQQNTFAQRQLRASLIANETLTALRTVGWSRLNHTTGIFQANCMASVPTAFVPFTKGLHAAVPPNVPGTFSICTVDLDTVAAGNPTVRAMTAGYQMNDATVFGEEDDLFTRVLIAYRNTAAANAPNSAVNYVTVVVSWRALGEVKSVVQSTALYDPARNESNVEL